MKEEDTEIVTQTEKGWKPQGFRISLRLMIE